MIQSCRLFGRWKRNLSNIMYITSINDIGGVALFVLTRHQGPSPHPKNEAHKDGNEQEAQVDEEDENENKTNKQTSTATATATATITLRGKQNAFLGEKELFCCPMKNCYPNNSDNNNNGNSNKTISIGIVKTE
ncbi:uncharacterized protein LOC106096150 [Stomoxys calcitrans]|uniref:uncharacterized protein LOC106096150 n=1 Tax=Stomoxys calcitrans TaxID=35570 RepID=UPI0027E3810A|nr:uncharacterized protein LOC106096150 [Stomoxys calcitrans]